MKQQIKLVAMDIDGTLLAHHRPLSKYTKEILEKVSRQGILFAIATGRAYKAIPEDVLNIKGVEFVITSNGSSIYRNSDKKRIFYQALEESQVEGLLNLYDTYGCQMEVFIAGTAYTSRAHYDFPEKYGADAMGAQYVKTTRIPVEDIRSFALEHKDEIEGLNWIVKEPEIKQEIRNKLSTFQGLYVTSSVPRYIEISHGNVSKEHALCWLAQKLNLTRQQIMAFGDGENDQEMIHYAGVGVAMDNASQKLKDMADARTLSAEEDGVAVFLEQFFER